MRKINGLKTYLVVAGILGLAVACAPSVENLTETVYQTNTVTQSNFVEVMVTNSPEQALNVDYMSHLLGEWLVTLETYTDYTNGLDENSNMVYLPYTKTNIYTSVSNDGMDGAFTFLFKADNNVDKIVYNGQGGIATCYTNAYIYSVYSNQYGQRIELENTALSEETIYSKPLGEFDFLSEPTNTIIHKTNITENYAVTNFVIETNMSFIIITETNSWDHYIERKKIILSYCLNLTLSETVSNMEWQPDTNFYCMAQDSRSQIQDDTTVVYTDNEDGTTTDTHIELILNDSESFQLMKIK